jgi:pimeloyl-[acyl-carrier protein] synthase
MTNPSIDLGDPAFLADPYPFYAHLRQVAPVHRGPGGMWLVTGYDEVALLLRDPRMAKALSGLAGSLAGNEESATQSPLVAEFGRWMLFRDPPEHTRLRTLVVKAFTPRVIESKRAEIQGLADDLLDRALQKGHLEAIADFAYLLPFTVIAGMLGLPSEDHPQCREWTTAVARAMDPVKSEEQLARANEAVMYLRDYVSTQVEERRARPKDDLLSALLAVEAEGETLSEDELISNVMLLFGAGHETTMNLIGNGLYALLQNPEQLSRLKAEPELISSAVEELLRFDSAVQFVHRWAAAPIEIGGTVIEAGAEVLLFIAAANRDPNKFENPDALDITRRPNRHLAFGGGPHFCLGSALARLEGRVALEAVLSRFREASLAGETAEYKDNLLLRGLKALPVNLGIGETTVISAGEQLAQCPMHARR